MNEKLEKSEVARVFIVGVGRSGTSLLQSVLASHSLLAFCSETGFVRRFVVKNRVGSLAATGGVSAVERHLQQDAYFGRTGIDAGDLLKNVQRKGRLTDASVYREMLRFQAERSGRPFAGDKDPRCIEFLGVIRDLLPETHVVLIVRDPRDVVLSRKNAEWSRKRSLIWHIFATHVQTELGAMDGPSELGVRYHEVVYEELVHDPENVLMMLCAAIGVPFEKDMLRFSAAARKLAAEEEVSWKKETFGPLLKDNTRKWMKGLSDRENALVEECVARPFSNGLYRRSGAIDRLPLIERMVVRLVGMGVRFATPVYVSFRHWIVDRARRRL